MAQYEGEPDEARDDASVSEYGELTRRIKAWVREDMRHVSKWRKEAREDFSFYSGKQWDAQDSAQLRDQDRPEITWNRVGPFVNAVVGSEINNRREVRFFPREQGDAIANEILTDAVEWFRDECNAEDEESDAFQDCVIGGMGWADTRLDFEDEPDGSPKIERLDCFEMGWDCYAVKPNLEDARRLWRFREMAIDDASDLTGVSDPYKLNAAWARILGDDGTGNDAHDQNEADQYTGSQNEFVEGGTYKKKTVLLGEVRWIEREVYWRGEDFEDRTQERTYTDEQLKLARKAIPDLYAVKQRRKVVRRVFIGSEVLGEPDTPMVPPGTGLMGWECITGYKDKIDNQWYGIVRAAKDPQRWSNKFFSQVMYLLNSQSKGGVMYEKDAIEAIEEFEESWARSDAATPVKSGALERGKIQPKPVAQFPAGFFTLFQTANEAITEVTGLSMEFLGLREVDQAGVLEYQRRQSSLNILASLFNALRRYRKRQGRILLHLIQKHLADGRLIRIVGDGKAQYVPLSREQIADIQYDIIVDDSPSSPNEKERTWQIIMEMLPLVKDFMDLETAVELLDASPLPATMVAKIKERFQKKQEQQAEQPSPEEQQMQAEQQMRQKEHDFTMAEKSADLQGKQIDLQVKQAEAGMELQGQQAKQDMDARAQAIDLLMKMREAEMQRQIDERKLEVDMANLAIKERANAIAAKRANAAKTNAAKQ